MMIQPLRFENAPVGLIVKSTSKRPIIGPLFLCALVTDECACCQLNSNPENTHALNLLPNDKT
jgi:hypothetical protein